MKIYSIFAVPDFTDPSPDKTNPKKDETNKIMDPVHTYNNRCITSVFLHR